MVTIVVIPRRQITGPGDYHASVEGSPEMWGNGRTPNIAIGNLVRSHGDQVAFQRCALLINNPELTYQDIGEQVRRDCQELGIMVQEINPLDDNKFPGLAGLDPDVREFRVYLGYAIGGKGPWAVNKK